MFCVPGKLAAFPLSLEMAPCTRAPFVSSTCTRSRIFLGRVQLEIPAVEGVFLPSVERAASARDGSGIFIARGTSVIQSELMDRERSAIGNLVSVSIVGCIVLPHAASARSRGRRDDLGN